jgi:nitrite reductase (NADH) large subunit
MAGQANHVFKNYTLTPSVLPEGVWMLLRGLVFAFTLGVIFLLLTQPNLGLPLFWNVLIPLLPTLLVLAPGLWRQICPMAFTNQIPRMGGFSWAKTLPQSFQKKSYVIAVALFLSAITLRVAVFNTQAVALAGLLIIALCVPFLGGLVFKGRSGWCGTFCPLGPLQKAYGQAPVVVVPNGYCKTCVGCQSNCYDFNPQAAIFNDMDHDDPAHAGQRRFFVSMLPGLVLGFFAQGGVIDYGYSLYVMILLGAAFFSAGLYQALVSFLNLSPYRTSVAFAGVALAIFYGFTGPKLLATLADFIAVSLPPEALVVGQFWGVGVGLILLFKGVWNEQKVLKAQDAIINSPFAMKPTMAKPVNAQFAQPHTASALAKREGDEWLVTDAQTQTTYTAHKGQTLLAVLEGKGIDMKACCRSGICGADPVLIVEGMENLSAPSEDEIATLKRLGLEGKGRMACSCRVMGSVTLDRRVGEEAVEDKGEVPLLNTQTNRKPLNRLKGTSQAVPQGRISFASRDYWPEGLIYQAPTHQQVDFELGRVVIIGNGIAGMTAAEELRRQRADVEIMVLSAEPYSFYNRMALNKIFEGLSEVEGLLMSKARDMAKKRIDVRLNAKVSTVDRTRKQIKLESGQVVLYDKLILANGASPSLPKPDFLTHQNAFVLRNAQDALAIREYILDYGSETAVIIGGGVLGVEAAEALARLGVRVTLVHRMERLMDRQLDVQTSERLAWYLEDLGVTLIMNANIETYHGHRHLESFTLSDGCSLSADIFLACAGTIPNKKLAEEAGLRVNWGVQVNRYMKTSDPSIYAIGDVAELQGEISGLWAVATAHAHTAIACLLGHLVPYVAPRSFMKLKSEGLNLVTFGNVIDIPEHAEVLTSPPDQTSWWRMIIEGTQIRGALFTGPLSEPNPIENLLGSPEDRAQTIQHLRHFGKQEFKQESKEEDVKPAPAIEILMPLQSVPLKPVRQSDPQADPFVYIQLSSEESEEKQQEGVQEGVQQAIMLPPQQGSHLSFPLLTLKNREAKAISQGSVVR